MSQELILGLFLMFLVMFVVLFMACYIFLKRCIRVAVIEALKQYEMDKNQKN